DVSALLAQHRLASRSGLLLSTCNRTELYWSGDHDLEPWFRGVARDRGADLTGALNRFDGGAAVRHLFTVVAGLDSQILGESEILGQVRRACEISRTAGTTSRDMDMIFGAATGAGRRVRRETMLGRHPSSVGSASVRLGLTLVPRPPRTLVLGAGEVAEGVLRTLHEVGASQVTLVNRNPERAAGLAGSWGIEARRWEELPALLAAADLVLVTTGATRPCVGTELLAAATGGRSGQELVVMDLAVPRNVAPEARTLPGVRLLDLDDLQRLCCPVGEDPMASIGLARAEQILLEEMARLDLAMRGRAIAPRLTELHRVGAELAEREAAWALSRLDGLSEREQQVVREMADRLVRRVLYPVSRSIRLDEATDDEAEEPLTA
ncbi:MAG TPA: glutamyl-tRNA reductase, partial [Gemmatimonadales bacterium]|nr:glutamyl-tRNA reductase [Gemmatimonadales bacterium]